ncbi:hypothetical protein GCM10027067_41740 [Pseudactinotalea suaedae]
MNPLTDRAQQPSTRQPRTRRGERALTWALLGSVLVAVLTGALLVLPELNAEVYLSDQVTTALARTWVSGQVLTGALLGVAALGAAAAALGRIRPDRGWVTPATTITAAIQVVTFAVLAQGMGTLSAFGYLTALAVPVILVVLGVQLVRTRPRARIPVALAAIGAGVLLITGRDVVASYVTNMAPALLREASHLLAVVLTMATAVAWAAVLLTRAAEAGSLMRATRWVTRHRVLLTVLAALGPLPYGLARLTWLTPWPQLGGDAVADDPAMALQGLLLGAAAWLGVVLTLGLVARWGEVFPRWFPGRAGRPVPPLLAIIPGGGVALMLCGSAIPLLQTLGLEGALVFPAWFWGPALALAVWGYAGHRAGVLKQGAAARPDASG